MGAGAANANVPRHDAVRRVTRRSARGLATIITIASALALGACQGAGPDRVMLDQIAGGEYGQARQRVASSLPSDPGDRDYLLQRLKLGILQVADGLPKGSERVFQQIYEVLDTKGVNQDKALAAVLLNEDLKIWKGEPFEQAMGWHYMALRAASVADWDNMRAAADSSLFLLADFGRNERGERLSTVEIGERAAKKTDGDYLRDGYTTQKSNFVLGFMMKGIAAQALIRPEESQAQFAESLRLNPGLKDVIDRLASGKANTILVVDYGIGPAKVAYGPDNALARFTAFPGYPSDSRGLSVRVEGAQSANLTVPVAHDVTTMAADHMWNNLQDVRQFKSLLGNALLVGGAVTTGVSRRRDTQIAGLALIAAGLFAKAGAHADTRYCDAMPQCVYVVPLTITDANPTVELQVTGDPASRFRRVGLNPPTFPERLQVRSVRLNAGRNLPAWATSGTLVYANENSDGRAPAHDHPDILGGTRLRTPTPDTKEIYHNAGNLLTLTASDLQNLYRAEQITWRVEDEGGLPKIHVLEGGSSLVAPLAGTAGFARLFCQAHPPYSPRSGELKSALQRLAPARPPPR